MPDQPQIPEAVYRVEIDGLLIPAAMHFGPEVGDAEKVAQHWRNVGARVTRYALPASHPADRKKSTDAAKFAEREYERVCEERNAIVEQREDWARQFRQAEAKLDDVEEQSVARGDRVIELERALVDERSKLAQVHEPVARVKGHLEAALWNVEQRSEIDREKLAELLAEDIALLGAILNNSDSTEVDNG